MLKRLSSQRTIGYGSLKVHHFSLLPPSFDYYKDYLKNIYIDGVSDRFHFSELVYGPVLRGKVNPLFDDSRQDMVQLELLVTGSLFVYCKCKLETIAERFVKRGDENVKKIETLKDIVTAFDSFNFGIDGCVIQTDTEVSETRLNQVVDDWFRLRERAKRYAEIGNGWGTLDEGCTLVVGERPNDEGTYWPRPFSVPNPIKKSPGLSSSTDWVLTMLRLVELMPRDFHVTNAYPTPTSNESTLANEIEFLKPKRIIAMGKTASDMIKEIGIQNKVPVMIMPHPQYLRRFYQSSFACCVEHVRNFVMSKYPGGAVKEWKP
jgi:hypothetical protein